MAAKPFMGKQTKAEEMKEAKMVRSGKMTPAQYAAKEKAEGDTKSKGALMARGKQLASGKMTPAQYGAKATGVPKKMAGGGMVYSHGGMVKKNKPC